MSLLLDTHILLWWLADDARLPPTMRIALLESDTEVFVSAASAWEIAIKSAIGKLQTPDGLREQMQVQGFRELSITMEDALTAGSLPRHHDDPFDRMLIAQAVRRDLLLLSVDRRVALYDVRRM